MNSEGRAGASPDDAASDRRLRTALIFSAVCLVVVVLGSWVLDVRLKHDETDRAFAMVVPALGLALASVWAGVQLTAALLDRRPVYRDRTGRWLWMWTLAYSVTFVALGLDNSSSQTMGQLVLYASGLLIGLIGGIGVCVSLIPRWTGRRT